jgi:hypothetical protein
VPRKNFILLLRLLLIADGIIVGALVSATGSWKIGVPVGIGAMVLPFLLIPLITGGIMRTGGWGRIASAFPPAPWAEGTKGTMADTLTVGRVPMSNAVEVATDDDYLHLTPLMTLGKWCPAVSIPWAEVSFPDEGRETKSLLTGKSVKIAAAGVTMLVPTSAVRRELEVRRAMASGAGAEL